MNLRLWFRLFTHQLILLLGSLLFLVSLLVLVKDRVDLFNILSLQYFGIPIWSYILAFILVVSFAYASFLTLKLGQPYERLKAQLNWLLLDKYRQAKASQLQDKNWYHKQVTLNREVDQLATKLQRLSSDLQEFSAAPTFVGEDTKEELIEEERLRIARELHDSVSQDLFAATMLISALKESHSQLASDQLKQQIQRIDQTITRAQIEMRALLLHLRPVELKDRSLSQGLQQILQELQGKLPMEVVWRLDDQIRLESGVEDHLFRIAQESISNTLRHAQAQKLEVYLNQTPDTIDLAIIDDGRGFQMDQVKQAGNYGLTNIQERVQSLGGDLAIQSQPGQGTRLLIRIPVIKSRMHRKGDNHD